MGNFYVDMWRGMLYVVPAAFADCRSAVIVRRHADDAGRQSHATTLEAGSMGTDRRGQAKPQMIARGPVAAIVAIKQFWANGGGFFGANSAHPFENPNSWTNFVECVGIILVPLARGRHVRPDAEEHAARRRDLRRDDGHAVAADWVGGLQRHGNRTRPDRP